MERFMPQPRPRFCHQASVAVFLSLLVGGAGQTAAEPEPQRTSATYGDWELRCDRTTGTVICEAVQVIANQQGQTVAQIAIGSAASAAAAGVAGAPPDSRRLALIVPASANLAIVPHLLPPAKDAGTRGTTVAEVPLLDLVWRRCLPEACVADAALRDDVLRRLRSATDTYRIVLQDGMGRDRVVPMSPRGLGETLDAMTK
jgi:invasion protein IalB